MILYQQQPPWGFYCKHSSKNLLVIDKNLEKLDLCGWQVLYMPPVEWLVIKIGHMTIHDSSPIFTESYQHCEDKKIPSFKRKWSEVKVTQSCPTLWDTIDYTVCGILQARILEWVAFPFSRGSSQPRDRTQVSLIAGKSPLFSGLPHPRH